MSANPLQQVPDERPRHRVCPQLCTSSKQPCRRYWLQPKCTSGCRTIPLEEGDTEVGWQEIEAINPPRSRVRVHRSLDGIFRIESSGHSCPTRIGIATFTCGPEGVTLISRGSFPISVRLCSVEGRVGAPWRGLSLRGRAVLAPGDEIAFDSRDENHALTTFVLHASATGTDTLFALLSEQKISRVIRMIPPPTETAMNWLGQLSLGQLHKSMSVCKDWRQMAREDVRFHMLSLRAAESSTDLTDHDLSFEQASRVTDDVLARCLACAGPRLKSLTLNSLQCITHAPLSALSSLPKLELVDLTRCHGVTGEVCSYIPASVRSVRLQGCRIDRASLDQLLNRPIKLDVFPCKTCDCVIHAEEQVKCRSCPTEFCRSCEDIYHCILCETIVCQECQEPNECDICNELNCRCLPLVACGECGNQHCARCEDDMVGCDACNNVFCDGHDRSFCECGDDECAVVCSGCENQSMRACEVCDRLLYLANHDFFACAGCDKEVCERCYDNDWLTCLRCDEKFCHGCVNQQECLAENPERCEAADHCASNSYHCRECTLLCERCKACLLPGMRCHSCNWIDPPETRRI